MVHLTKMTDKLLDRIVGKATAGACVPTVGDYCYCAYPKNSSRKVYWYVSCTGPCAPSGTYC